METTPWIQSEMCSYTTVLVIASVLLISLPEVIPLLATRTIIRTYGIVARMSQGCEMDINKRVPIKKATSIINISKYLGRKSSITAMSLENLF